MANKFELALEQLDSQRIVNPHRYGTPLVSELVEVTPVWETTNYKTWKDADANNEAAA